MVSDLRCISHRKGLGRREVEGKAWRFTRLRLFKVERAASTVREVSRLSARELDYA